MERTCSAALGKLKKALKGRAQWMGRTTGASQAEMESIFQREGKALVKAKKCEQMGSVARTGNSLVMEKRTEGIAGRR